MAVLTFRMITRHLSRRITPLVRRNSAPLKNVSQESSSGKMLLVGATFLKAVTPLVFGFGFIYAYRSASSTLFQPFLLNF